MPGKAPDAKTRRQAKSRRSRADNKPAAEQRSRWSRLGLAIPVEFRESRRLLRHSQSLYAMARHVSRSTPCPEDAASLLRKAIYQLFCAVARLDGVQLASYAEARERMAASANYRRIFQQILDELPFLEELHSSFDLVLARRDGQGDSFHTLMRRMPALFEQVRRHTDKRLRQSGVRLVLRRSLAALGLLMAAGGLVLLLYARTLARDQRRAEEGSALWMRQANVPEPPGVVADPSKCFQATYFGDRFFDKPVHKRRDCKIAFDWGELGVTGIPSLPSDGFSVRWQGVLKVPATDDYTFYLMSDDGSRLYLNDELVVENWGDHGPIELASRSIRLRAGTETKLRVDYFEGDGIAQVALMWSATAIPKQVLPGRFIVQGSPTARPVPGADAGASAELLADPSKCFTASYFRGTDFESLAGTRRDCRIAFDWKLGGPAGVPDLPVDGFSVRWEGTLQVPETAEYVFYLGSDDGSRLFIDGENILGDWGDHSFKFVKSDSQRLEEGIGYPIRVEFYERADLASIRLEWSSPQMQRTVLSGQHITPVE